MSEDKGPVESAVELAVYAPLGLALEAQRLLPTFIERGRQQVEMAKLVGRFAVQQGQHQAEDRLGRAQAQAESVLAELGLRERGPGADPAAPAPAAPMAAPTGPPPPTPARSGAGAAELAIADYDSLAASQVIPRLAGLGSEELDAVWSYEAAHRGRKTILGKVAQLQGA